METVNPQCRVSRCFKCPGDAEYFCCTCNTDLCLQCKERHCSDLKTLDHNIVINREKKNIHILKKIVCNSHPHSVCGIYCKPCELPACFECLEHSEHQILDLRAAYESKRQQYKRTIHIIKSRNIPYCYGLLAAVKADIEICHTEISCKRVEVIQQGQRLISQLDNMLRYVDFKHRCLKQKRDWNRYIARIERYENIHEQSHISQTNYLLFLKKKSKPMIQDSLHLKHHTCQLSISKSIILGDVMESLHKLKLIERGKRLVRNDCLLKLIPVPELHQSLTLSGLNGCGHMSFVTTDKIWVSNYKNLIMTNITGDKLHQVNNKYDTLRSGLHTVNGNNDLIYINSNYEIVKISNDLKKTSSLISPMHLKCLPLCVYWSSLTGDLLVGTHFKVNRYDQDAKLMQTIKGVELYRGPRYITENNNEDVVVSDFSKGVVVTERGGNHRFTYSGNPPRSLIDPGGICTDALSHILVCDCRNDTVHRISADGQFLSYLLIRPSGIFRPQSLLYDKETNRLWVGSANNNKVNVYRYITQRSTWTLDQNYSTDNVTGSRNQIQNTEIENPHNGNDSLPKLESYESFSLRDVSGCYHISCSYSDDVWISDDEENLVLMGTLGSDFREENIYHINDLCCEYTTCYGIHAVNSDFDVIYIDWCYDILKNDLKTSTPFLKKSYSKMKPTCVYFSTATDNLLVGMHSFKPKSAMVTRFNEAGQLTQTIQHDSTGQELYSEPKYITENKNGDIVVSDFDCWSGAVVVTERGGRYRFSYTGQQSGPRLKPAGICTDELSNILVCDSENETVQIIDKDGRFLSHILTKSQNLTAPLCLCYDDERHFLWVGSYYNDLVRVYKYIYSYAALSVASLEPDSLLLRRNVFDAGKVTEDRNTSQYGFYNIDENTEDEDTENAM